MRISTMTWVVMVCLATLAMLTAPGWALSSAAWYVAPTGNDANNCLSPVTACRTITSAMGRANAGDTIYLAAGTYSIASGDHFPIQLKPGRNLIGAGRESTLVTGVISQTVLHFEGSATAVGSETVIRDLTVQGGDVGLDIHAIEGQVVSPQLIGLQMTANRVGLSLSTSGDYFTSSATISPIISDVHILSNTETAFVIYAYTFGNFPCHLEPTVINSTLQGNGGDGLALMATSPSNGYCAAAPLLMNTRIASNGGSGISYAVGGYGTVQPQIERSIIVDNGGTGIRWGSTDMGFAAGDPLAVITNSIIANNRGGGVFVGTGAGGLRLVNSTIAFNDVYGIYWTDHAFGWAADLAVLNTIIWNESADDLAGRGATASEVQFSDIEDGDLQGQSGNIAADPALNETYHLSACSGAMNAGTSLGAAPLDIDGETRPLGTATDIGADEYDSPCWLSLSKAATTGRVGFYDPIAYTITVTNTTVLTPLQTVLTDSLPTLLHYLPGTAWASQGTATYANGAVTWSNVISPGEVVTIGFEARATLADTRIRNWVTVGVAEAGVYAAQAEIKIAPVKVYLPLLRKPLPGLFGRVTLNGAPIQGISLELRMYTGTYWFTQAVATTGADGSYAFPNVPSLGQAQAYYVRYLNTDNISGRLWMWATRTLTAYLANTAVHFGTFDIADIGLVSPANDESVVLPYTFQWATRAATPSDTYEFDLYDPQDQNPFFYTNPPLGYVGHYTLSGLPVNFRRDVPYVWEVWVYSPDGGYGISYMSRWVTFVKAGLSGGLWRPLPSPRRPVHDDWPGR